MEGDLSDDAYCWTATIGLAVRVTRKFFSAPSALLFTTALFSGYATAQGGPEGRIKQQVLPTVATGFVGTDTVTRFETAIVLHNLGSTSETAQVQIFQNNGSLVTRGGFTRSYNVPTNGIQAIEIFFQTIVPPPPFPDINGWALVTSTGSIEAQSEIRFMKDIFGSIFSSAHVPAVSPSKMFRVRLVDRLLQSTGEKRMGAYAIVNPSTEPAKVELVATLLLNALTECRATVQIPPMNRVARFAEEIFASCEAFNRFKTSSLHPVGFVTASSEVPIAVGALDIVLPQVQINNLPVLAIQP